MSLGAKIKEMGVKIIEKAKSWFTRVVEGDGPITLEKFLEKDIENWLSSEKRHWMVLGEEYYEGKQEILEHERYVIGENGKRQAVFNLHNSKIVDNQYSIQLDKKINYSFGQPFVIKTESYAYADLLKLYFGVRFQKTLRRVAYEAMEGGVGYLHPFYNEEGELKFKVFDNKNIRVFYKDEDHDEILGFWRLYEIEEFHGSEKKIIEMVDLYTETGIKRYKRKEGKLSHVEDTGNFHFKELALSWTKIPLIPFRYNFREVPLLKRIKALQDGINLILSTYENNMMEDSRNTILVLHNLDGQDMGVFRKNLATYGAVKVRSDGDRRGGVESLTIEVNAENYKAILNAFKNALIENARSFDAKDERVMGGDPNELKIKSMLLDMDIDANGMETEFHPALEELVWFVNQDLANKGKGQFNETEVEFIFNRDGLVSEKEVIANIRMSEGLLSKRTRVEQHPWVDDVEEELKRIDEEREEEMSYMFGAAFGGLHGQEEKSRLLEE